MNYKKTLEQISFLLNNNMEINIYNTNYQVKNDKGNLIVECKVNGHTTGLLNDELENCFTNKWNVREHKLLKGFNIFPNK